MGGEGKEGRGGVEENRREIDGTDACAWKYWQNIHLNHEIFSLLQKLSLVPSYLWDAMWAPVWKHCMKHCGKGVYIRPMSSDFKGLWNLSVGDGTSIPKGSTIYCTEAPCTIGKKVLFGPHPTIITGDHRIDIPGR